MNIAIVAATLPELQQIKPLPFSSHNIQYAEHGVGMISAAFHIQQIATLKPDLIIQCGIAGSYNRHLAIGESVIVESETCDNGAEEGEKILTVFDLSLTAPDEYPFENGMLPCPFIKNKKIDFQKVKGLTVSCTSGTTDTIQKRKVKFQADIETMEGAALHYTCLMLKIPFLQIRTVSNYVEVRNRSNWNIPLALAQNAIAVQKIIENI